MKRTNATALPDLHNKLWRAAPVKGGIMFNETESNVRHARMFEILRAGTQADMIARRKAAFRGNEAAVLAFQTLALDSFNRPEV